MKYIYARSCFASSAGLFTSRSERYKGDRVLLNVFVIISTVFNCPLRSLGLYLNKWIGSKHQMKAIEGYIARLSILFTWHDVYLVHILSWLHDRCHKDGAFHFLIEGQRTVIVKYLENIVMYVSHNITCDFNKEKRKGKIQFHQITFPTVHRVERLVHYMSVFIYDTSVTGYLLSETTS